MCSWYIRFVELFIILYNVEQITSAVEFTNAKCISLEPEFVEFEYCLLKSVNRSYKYFSVKANLHKKPVTKATVNFELMKRFSGYKPFLYNVTFDACRYLKNPKASPIVAYLHEFFKKHSNMNHTCPFDHDIIVDKLTTSFVNQHVTNVLPFPTGDYLLQTNWIAYDINRAKVSIYFTLS